MRSSSASMKWVLLLPIAMATLSFLTSAQEVQPFPHQPHSLDHLLNKLLQWRQQLRSSQEKELKVDLHTITAAALCFASASISSAGGVGGGALFLPILNLVAGLSLKTATTLSAFMVTGGAVSNVLYNVLFKGGAGLGGQPLVDYDIALLSEPCMLLGVTAGVVCNVVFPEWLVTLLFVMLLAWSTFKTSRAGVASWKGESEAAKRGVYCKLDCGKEEEEEKKKRVDVEGGGKGIHEPLLGGDAGVENGMPLKKMGVLLVIWLSFFLLQSLRGDKDGKGVIRIQKCGVVYWLITLSQVPLALLFTAYILYGKGGLQKQQIDLEEHLKDPLAETGPQSLPKVIFPLAALLSGVLGGLFGIGGGLLMNPVLLQIGVNPQTTAATSSFMVLFSSSMSSVQYLMLGMKGVKPALALATGCFLASLAGLIVVQRAVRRFGRASIIVFTVSTVMLLSMVSMTCFGAIDVWKDYVEGKYMGFKLPC